MEYKNIRSDSGIYKNKSLDKSLKALKTKKPAFSGLFLNLNNYLFITYIVTSKPKRISVAAGVVHMMLILLFKLIRNYLNVILLELKK
ncbi:hypothetical protein LBMAG29_00050 [Methylophilaceae bacterium]|nr:hypothetical protein LBMAG29_00050 [Methylophilaceae bacterium]